MRKREIHPSKARISDLQERTSLEILRRNMKRRVSQPTF